MADGKLIATEYLSPDGVFDEPGRWSAPFWGDEAAAFKPGELVRALTTAGLIDEYRFMVHPILLGEGPHLFPEGTPRTVLELVDTQPGWWC